MHRKCDQNQNSRRIIAWSLAVILAVSPLIHQFFSHAQGSSEEALYFTLLHTNDEHSAFVPYLSVDSPDREVGGFSRLATAIETVKAERAAAGEPVLLLSAGDFLGETAFGWLSTLGMAPEMDWLLMMEYDAVTIGNHEYDFGPDVLASYLQAAGYPEAHGQTLMLAANTQAPPDHPLAAAGLYQPSGIITLDNGLRIGIFGLIGVDAISVTVDTGDIVFLDQHETARQEVRRLREQGAELIIALTHSGDEEDIDLARDVEGIHLIVGGHSHTLLEEPLVEGNTLIVQAGAQTSHLGQLELAFHRETGQLRVRNGENNRPFVIAIDDQFEHHPQTAEKVTIYTEHLNQFVADMTGGRFPDVFGTLAQSPFILTNKPELQETPVGNFITDGMRLITGDITGRPVDVAIQANGSIRGSMVPRMGSSTRGDLSFYDITNTIGLGYGQDGYPGYSVASVYLTGEELRRVLEVASLLQELMGDNYFLQFSGLSYDYNPQNTVLLTIPVMEQPIPTTRAITEAHLYRGEGIQPVSGGRYIPLERGDDTLYHLATDTYILSFLPLAGEMLPQLEIVPKNQQGEPVPIERLHELTVPYNGRELKVWETVALYAASLPDGPDGIPLVPEIYSGTAGRINAVSTFPYLGWLVLGLAVVMALLVWGIRWIVCRRRSRTV